MKKVSVRFKGNSYQYRFEKYKVDGKRTWEEKGRFATAEEALIAGKKAQEIYYNGGDKIEVNNISYNDYLTEWLNESKKTLKFTTISTYSTIVKLYVKPKLGEYGLSTISSRTLKRFMNELIKETNLTKAYYKNVLKVIKASFRSAVDSEYIENDPSINLRLPKEIEYKESITKHFYTNEDVRVISERFKNNRPFLMAFYMARYTGLRTSELFALSWDDVDLENGYIMVKYNVHDRPKDEKGRWFFGSLKTKNSYRKIPITDTLKSLLLKYKKEQDEIKDILGNKYIYYHLEEVDTPNIRNKCYRIVKSLKKEDGKLNLILTKENGSYVGTDLIKHPYKIIHNELGLKCRFYDHRGTLATELYNNNPNDLDAFKDLFGHKCEETTKAFYLFNDNQDKYPRIEQMMQKVDKSFSSI